MTTPTDFNINELTNHDNNYWRVDWFGYLHYFNQYGQRFSEPLVDVYLSAFKSKPNSSSLNYKTSTNFSQPNRVCIPISYLMIVRLGDVWHKGRRLKLKHSMEMRECFQSTTIDIQTTATLQSGAKDTKGNHIIPFAYHPYHKPATHTYCEIINLPDGNRIAIPHYVILQAYFSESQYVFQQIFKFGLQLDSIYDPAKSYINDSGEAFIMLKAKTHDSAASQVARLAFDKKANTVISNISPNMSIQKNTGQPIRPKAGFPFENQTTNLNVYGKWCHKEEAQNKTFIVYDILGCSAAYPFTNLKHFRDNPGDKDPNSPGTRPVEGQSKSGKPKPRVKKDNQLELQPQEEPTNKMEELLLEKRRGTEFSDLVTKNVEKQRQDPHKNHKDNASGPPNEKDVGAGNTGDGSSNGAIPPVDFCLPPSEYENRHIFKNRICRLELFLKLLSILKSSPYITHSEFIQVFSGLGAPSSVYSYFPDTWTDTRRKSTWQYINYIKGFNLAEQKKHRRAIIANLTISSHATIYLIDIERRTASVEEGWIELDSASLFLAICHGSNTLSRSLLSSLIENCAENRGTWKHEMIEPYAESYSLKHSSNLSVENGQYVERQIAIIEKYIGFKFS
ncbi:hypothetical protein [Vibrio mangrovi]|uniref:Transposon Tn7 transposition protein TnsE n=1 Tax=Vibrio mangrovi TaxID=474394 RepID=A0ABU4I320_9VIBR|nr:hypothetical protein [Vibrio mangrovi]MDW6002330.1 hypothetical protein [Vibrio mangrovi]